ncbi:MAG: hypothetical protein MK213_06855, partial [Planctomycetes bacterium]|nr:hypothetical protein [Planctomycetota bacterium]
SPVFSVRDSRALKGRKGSPHRGVMNLLDELAGRPVSWAEPMSAPELGSRLLCSTLPGRKGVTPEELSLADELLDGRWTIGSNRRVSQTSGGIRSQPLFKEEGAVALTLGQVLDGERQEVFEFLNERQAGMPAQRWLWGIAVDLGLELPSQADAPLHEYEAGALLRWAAQDEEKGALQASHFRLQARLDWDQHPQLDRSWPSLAVLALAPEAKDLQLLRGLAEGLTPGQERLQLLWQLASGRLSRDAESALLHQWARELGIGVAGYLDDQGPCWAAAYLITGTLAAEGVARLQPPLSSFERDLDHSPGNQLYADIAEVLLSGVFRWNPLP